MYAVLADKVEIDKEQWRRAFKIWKLKLEEKKENLSIWSLFTKIEYDGTYFNECCDNKVAGLISFRKKFPYKLYQAYKKLFRFFKHPVSLLITSFLLAKVTSDLINPQVAGSTGNFWQLATRTMLFWVVLLFITFPLIFEDNDTK